MLGTKAGNSNVAAELIDDVRIEHKQANPYQKILDYIAAEKKQKSRVLFSVESEGRRESLLTLLKPTGSSLSLISALQNLYLATQMLVWSSLHSLPV